MMDRDYLWCALNLLLDDEEALEELCPECRAAAERGVCPSCGRETEYAAMSENEGFDEARYERLKRGGTS